MPTKTFDYTGGWQQFDVPKNVEYVTVTLDGAGSGQRQGGRVTGRIKVTDKQTLFIQVGEKGQPNKGADGGRASFGGGGAGGDGRGSNDGGYGGGGATAIRLNSRTGLVKAVAGGAGGGSGDGGPGGAGGGNVGENGWPAEGYPDAVLLSSNPERWHYDSVGNATGGTQTQGGNKGTSGAGSVYDGNSAFDSVLSRGGAGGGPKTANTFGGGGGGGGYRAGGGGQSGFLNETPGGGGGGGSNYIGGLIGYQTLQGQGGTGHGTVTLTWTTPPPANQPPNPPTEVHINGKNAADGFETNSTGTVQISAKLSDPDKDYDKDGKPTGPSDRVRLVAFYSPHSDFSRQVRRVESDLVEQANNLTGKKKETGRAGVALTGLAQNTRYYVRLYARDSHALRSTNYTSVNFWTNRYPTAPDQVLPPEDSSYSELASVVFQWTHRDPDQNTSQRAFELQWRRARTPITPAGEWVTRTDRTWFNQYVANPGEFQANSFYEWRVRTQDPQGKWGPYSGLRSFFVTGESAPPTPLDPTRNEAVDVTQEVTFSWRFRDPDPGDQQAKADLRYRAVGEADWITHLGTTLSPGAATQWTFPVNTLVPGVHYEWQVRTQDSLTSAVSGWSDSAYFWSTATPGVGAAETTLPTFTYAQGSLGCGDNRVFIYDRGGRVLRGEVTPTSRVQWTRRRDDIANALISTNGFGDDCGNLLREIHCWMHEVVIFRDGERVFEGPITRITDTPDGVEIEAKDVMAYVYRRIMRQGYNDSYRVVNGEQLGQSTVVERAVQIVMNALVYDDPNLLPYLTSLNFPDDAGQSRNVPDYSRTAWEEVDDLAATAGLDYTAAGRRIIFWDTHRPLGRLPELRDENFDNPPVITEYGMQTATHFGVTNNSGVYGVAERSTAHYGNIEQLASAYGETEGGTGEILTQAARESLERTLTQQAERNIAPRWPTPLIVRVPDNSRLHAETPVTINQLIPGVWVPLRARGTVREIAQWQKLDLVTVEQTSEGEKVMVTMSPAPNGGADPDADAAASEE